MDSNSRPDSDFNEIQQKILEDNKITYDVDEKYQTVYQILAQAKSDSEESNQSFDEIEDLQSDLQLKKTKFNEENEEPNPLEQQKLQAPLVPIIDGDSHDRFRNIASFIGGYFKKNMNYSDSAENENKEQKSQKKDKTQKDQVSILKFFTK